MALELLPDGTFKKLSKVQTDALDRYYKRENKRDLTTEVIAQFPLILATSIAAAAYVFRDEIKEKIKEEGIDLGLGLAKLITRIPFGKAEPMEPEFVPSLIDPEIMVEIPRCERYAADYVNQNTIAEGIPFVGVTLQALSQLYTIKA